MKTGIMLMSDRGPDGRPIEWKEHLRRCKERGLETVDLFESVLAVLGETVTSMKKILRDMGLEPGIYCVATDLVSPDETVRRKSLDTIRRGIECCHELGVSNLFSYGGQHNNEGEEAFLRYVDGLQKAADICAAEGITLSIENAGKMCHTDVELERCLDLISRPNMKITFDGGNFILAGCDPHKAAELLAPKVVHVHAKSFVPDATRQPRPFRYVPIGEGLVDYRRIRDILVRAGFDGIFSFEPEGGEDSRWYESVATVADIVREVNQGE